MLGRVLAALGLGSRVTDGERPTVLQLGAMIGLIAVAMTVTALAGRPVAAQQTAATPA